MEFLEHTEVGEMSDVFTIDKAAADKDSSKVYYFREKN